MPTNVNSVQKNYRDRMVWELEKRVVTSDQVPPHQALHSIIIASNFTISTHGQKTKTLSSYIGTSSPYNYDTDVYTVQ
ncbi:hypothetical protein NPIL_350511 [Nephila pilipes]|uniref:Uncharacterized protein n=1 Tax=Nephila pilipes TaxID=299642 RepID=A0A8X6ICC5_NEPPI|nr:hypothetical protein NPIL_350511 [Nephila pilipes]